ncbi:MAG TPA: ATP-binding protein [Acidobacteriota bacterium]|nr:ATP-binding protein [Acidobacteriota bacterium]
MKQLGRDKTVEELTAVDPGSGDAGENTVRMTADMFADLEATLEAVAETNPRIKAEQSGDSARNADLRALLETTLAVNSSLVLDNVLQRVMHKAIELMQAERGLIMLLDENERLQVKSAYNLCKEEMMEEDFYISSSVTSEVARTGKPVYTSDAMADDRYAHHKSVMELHLRSIMCVPLIVKEKVIGVIYLDNSSQTKMFLKSDLYLFELYAQLASNALHNASIYDSLLRLEQYNESVVSTSPVGIIVVDSRGAIATINPAALEIFDLDVRTVRITSQGGQPSMFLDCIPESERSRWRSMITTALATKQEYADPRFYHNTGYVEKVLSLKLCPLAGLTDGSDGLVMTAEDVTEKITMEQYVILSEKLVAKGEMAASVAHELNNYLSIISNNAELLTMNIDRGKLDKIGFNARSITENILKIKRFVDNLMDFSRPESEYVTYDLNNLVEDVLFSLHIQPRFKLIHFTNDLNAGLPKVEIDVGQIQQVLMNLLINAADAIGERSTHAQDEGREFTREIAIRTSYDKDTDQAIVEVSDNGTGMASEVQEKIFALHFSTKKGGHGLGLHNCRKILELHGGDITVHSKENEGSVFRIVIPRVQRQKALQM